METALEVRQPAEVSTPADLVSVIARAAADPTVDVAKMQALLDMHERISNKQAEIAFNQALAALQPKLPRITKNGVIDLGKGKPIQYARYEDITAAIQPLLDEYGFSVTYDSELSQKDNLLKVIVTVRHIQGHSDKGQVFLPLTDTSGAKNSVQGGGSILSYGKRYALCNYFNIVTEGQDTDGVLGMQPITEDQANKIRDRIIDRNVDEKRFLHYMGVDSVESIPHRRFNEAIAALDRKRR